MHPEIARSTGTRCCVVIELKIVTATGTDLVQLQSYLEDLKFAGYPPEQIKGVLIAPGFAQKVLNAAGGDRRIFLLRYLLEEDR